MLGYFKNNATVVMEKGYEFAKRLVQLQKDTADLKSSFVR